MAKWTFEPGHTSAEFKVRHMMVTYVRGSFKNVRGTLEFDVENLEASSIDVSIDADAIWSGDKDRDAHLRGPDFLDTEHQPLITYTGSHVQVVGEHDFVVAGDLTIRGVTKTEPLRVHYLGGWDTPWWEDGEDKGPRRRAGFAAVAEIDRHDFGVSWNGTLDRGGIVVGNTVYITIDAEAILDG